MESIPLVDLSIQNLEVAEELRLAMAQVIDDGSFVLGPAVGEFEEAFARYAEVRHCVGVGNGGDALELMLRAFDVGPGCEVIVPANTFIATAVAVLRTGAVPVLVDCDPRWHLIDPQAVAAHVSPRTRGVIAVHLFGQMADMDALEEITERAGILLFEDAAQSHGARQHGRSAGGCGVAAATSFYPGKNLGAFGDAGAVFGNDERIGRCVPLLRNYGSASKYEHPEVGFNSRLDAIQAVVLTVKLRKLGAWNEQRRRAAKRYDRLLADISDVTRPETRPGNDHVWHLYVIQTPERDRVLEALQANGISAGVHYPKPIHLQGAFAGLGLGVGTFPNAEAAASKMLSLPIYPGIREDQQEKITEVLHRAFR